jgi:hypothetical protein
MAAALLVRVGRYLIRYGQNSSITLDSFETTVTGLGGHAARSHKCIDSVLVGAQLITALQSIVSRSIDPLESAVILLVTEAAMATNDGKFVSYYRVSTGRQGKGEGEIAGSLRAPPVCPGGRTNDRRNP